MNENMKKFLEMISKDETLKQKVLACKDLEKDDVVRSVIALAKEMGIELTEADIIVEKEADGELAEEELTAVAGGFGCGCPLVGGGGGTDDRDGHTDGCACVGYGQGGDGRANDTNCVCYVGGCGTDANYDMYGRS